MAVPAICELTFRVGVVNNSSKTPAFSSQGGPLQHLQVAIRVAKGKNRLTANMLINPHGFSGFVINEVDFRFPHQYRLPGKAG